MGLIETLYEWKHGSASKNTIPENCESHNFGDWNEVDRSENKWLDDHTEYFDYAHNSMSVAVKYDRDGSGGVDKSNPMVVPYDEVAEIWCNLSGRRYYVVVIRKDHKRECHCGESERSTIPVKYVAFYCDEIVAEAPTREELDRKIISHNKTSDRSLHTGTERDNTSDTEVNQTNE